MQGNNYGLLMKTIKKNSQNHFSASRTGSPFSGTKFAVRLIELPFTPQHDREIVMFRFYFPLLIKLCMALLCVIFKSENFTRGVLSIPACDVYVRLKTTGAAIKNARGTTKNQ